MNLRTSVAALTLALGSLVSVPAFAQSAPCNLPVAQPVVGQAVYPQPVYQQPRSQERLLWPLALVFRTSLKE